MRVLVLGVNRKSSKKEIHDAYLRKCMKCHPDLFPEKSQEFKDLQQAYERLMNWEKEKPHFDRTEHFKKKGAGSQEKIF